MEDLEVYVGLSIKVGNVYGVCDEVCGDKLGFVWSDENSWTGQLVDAKDVTICETEDECERGRLSALRYFEREVKSLQARINMGRKQDDLMTLVKELNRCARSFVLIDENKKDSINIKTFRIMITLRKETKRGSEFINAHKMSDISDIHEAYGRPSSAKCSAFHKCVKMCNKENGRCLRITGAGSHFFSVAWLTDDGLRVETACNSYIIK